jgi:hypothetical protein
MNDSVRAAIERFLAGPWGQVLQRHQDAKGVCERATLSLLAQLKREGLDDQTKPWLLTQVEGSPLPECRWAGVGATHMVLEHEGEAIDVSVRQFVGHEREELPRTEPIEKALARWNSVYEVDLNSVESGFQRDWIPPNWQDLADAPPPGEIPNWPYARHTLNSTSRFYAAPEMCNCDVCVLRRSAPND